MLYFEIQPKKPFTVPEMTVKGHSRSLEIAAFDKSDKTSYQSAIVSIALSYTIFEIFDVKEYRDHKSRLEVTHRANLCTVCTSLTSKE